ncbi:MAG: hypothetical protein EAZ30_17675 [Betaproteobacteria bacterium]|nr:MAG: hypothetical protein EAZ30_17675 [Betaproteobacteria bacterium]
MTIETIHADEMNDLAGRIEGLSWAVLHITAALEIKELIDGPHLSKMWRQALSKGNEQSLMRQSARDYLAKLADLLDEAREYRQSLAKTD